MGLLTFSINVTLDGCVDHQEGIYQTGLRGTRRLELVSANPLRNGAVATHYRRAR
jgi:hypothetical protein